MKINPRKHTKDFLAKSRTADTYVTMPFIIPFHTMIQRRPALIRTDYLSRASHVIRARELRITKHVTDVTYTMYHRHIHHGLEYIFSLHGLMVRAHVAYTR